MNNRQFIVLQIIVLMCILFYGFNELGIINALINDLNGVFTVSNFNLTLNERAITL